jgi:hypothetical protein
MVPGVPWDLPVNAPAWMRHMASEVATQNQMMLQGKVDKNGNPIKVDLTKIDYGRILTESVNYAYNPLRPVVDQGSVMDMAGGLGRRRQPLRQLDDRDAAHLRAGPSG